MVAEALYMGTTTLTRGSSCVTNRRPVPMVSGELR